MRRRRHHEEPEINFIALIDLLLVILIFLLVSTTYTRYNEIKVNLPTANTQKEMDDNRPKEIPVLISLDGKYNIEGKVVAANALEQALVLAAKDSPDSLVIISADANTSHQSVINVMEAARNVGLTQLTFATQTPVKTEAPALP
jgi:biopolymer transport protein ExbD